jgi:hypothetical protein
MKYILKKIVALSFLAVAFASCDKVSDLPNYGSPNTGVASVLSVDKTILAALPADSNSVGITFSWTNPKYANDSTTTKYTLEIDSSGRGFSKAVSKVVIGSLRTSFTNKEMNSILLGFGFAFNVAYDVDVRLITSYGNNNERIVCNTVKVKMTPYKVPPRVALPTSGKLFLVGDATQGGWTNPVPVPSQEFVRLNETTWAGVFNLNGGKQYLALPVNGDWSNKFSVANNTIGGLSAGGDFGFNLNDNFPGPATSGWYLITFDFQAGRFTCVPYTGPTMPTNLFIVGDATAGGWNNPVPVPSQQLTRQNSSVWTITMPLIGGKQFLLLPVNGSWANKYAVANNTLPGLSAGGDFGYNLNDNFPGPANNGTYTITVNFATGKFTTQ